jgi:RNA polymerase sigma-70 factor (ECF subfamily)
MAVDQPGSTNGASLPQSGDLLSTDELIARARVGDRSALDRLFARHHQPLRRWAQGRLPRWARDLADTDDVVQDTLIKVFRRITAFDPVRQGALQAYLRRAVLNRIRSELRRKNRQPGFGTLGDVTAENDQSPLELAIGRQALERYESALAMLRPEEREAVVGRIEMGYSYPELAAALGKPSADAARKAAERALLRLVEHMSRASR